MKPYDMLRDALSLKARRKIARQRVNIRRFSPFPRALPNLLIIGAQRCGTSSLYKYLQRHPQVRTSIRKEVEYFSFFYDRGERWYRAHFPHEATVRRSGARVTVEATPDYLLDPRAARRAAACVPDARIIVLLRDPVDRAFSHYRHNRRLSLEPLTFAQAIEAEEERVAESLEALRRDPEAPLPKPLRRFSYVRRGLYAEQLRTWLSAFPPARLLVVASDDLYAKPVETFRSVTGFLGIDGWTPQRFDNHSYIGRDPIQSEDPFPQELRDSLAVRFERSNRDLESLLGRPFDWTRSSSSV